MTAIPRLLTIRFECDTPEWRNVPVVAHGYTPEDVRADAERQRAALGGTRLIASGINNTRADWEAYFGPSDPSQGVFGDELR